MKIGFMHKLDAHNRVVVEEAAGIISICPNTANDGSKMNNYIGFLVIEHSADTTEIAQIIFGEIGDKNISAATVFAESANEVSPKKTPASSNGNSLRFKIDHSLLPNQGFFEREFFAPRRERQDPRPRGRNRS